MKTITLKDGSTYRLFFRHESAYGITACTLSAVYLAGFNVTNSLPAETLAALLAVAGV